MIKVLQKITVFGLSLAITGDAYDFNLVVVYRNKILLLRPYRWPKVWWHERARPQLIWWLSHLQVWPVYFEVFSRDCDLCESTRRVRAWCYWAGSRELLRAAEDWTEGPFHWRQISRREYLDFKPHWRDRIGEAFDNGEGAKVVL